MFGLNQAYKIILHDVNNLRLNVNNQNWCPMMAMVLRSLQFRVEGSLKSSLEDARQRNASFDTFSIICLKLSMLACWETSHAPLLSADVEIPQSPKVEGNAKPHNKQSNSSSRETNWSEFRRFRRVGCRFSYLTVACRLSSIPSNASCALGWTSPRHRAQTSIEFERQDTQTTQMASKQRSVYEMKQRLKRDFTSEFWNQEHLKCWICRSLSRFCRVLSFIDFKKTAFDLRVALTTEPFDIIFGSPSKYVQTF